MFSDIARLLIDAAAAIFGAALLLRLYMNWLGLPARNPLSQFVLALTDWLVQPLRRVIPPFGRIDLASLVAVLVLAFVAIVLSNLVVTGLAYWDGAAIRAPFTVLRWALNLVFWLTLLHVVLSWVNPQAPIAPAVSMLLRPFLAPFQRIIPLIGGLDLSPVALILVVNILLLAIGRAGF